MSRWPRLPNRLVASMLSAHAGLGVVAGALLYLVCVSGVLAVFHEDFARWEQPGAPEFVEETPQAVQAGLEAALQRHVAAHDAAPSSLYMVLPTEAAPRMIAMTDEAEWFVDETGALAEPLAHPYAEFLLDLHYYLHLPSTLGLTAVGGFGALMLGLVVSGFLAHPRVLRDAFHLRRSGSAQLREADLHNRLSVWGAPFHVVLALTGAMLGLSVAFALLLGATVEEDGYQGVFAPTFGAAGAVDETPAPLAAAGVALAEHQRLRPDVEPWFLDVEYPATAGQSVKILSRLPRRLTFGEYYLFDAAGRPQGQVGLEDGTIGQRVIGAAYQLHFGSFGALPVKLAYAGLGLALCLVVAGGVNLWLMKRRARGRASPRLETAWTGVVWGAPALMAACGLAAVAGGLAGPGLVAAFWIGLALLTAGAAATPATARRTLRRALIAATALLASAVVLGHWAIHAEAFTAPPAWGVTLTTLALSALALAVLARPRLAGRSRREAPASAE